MDLQKQVALVSKTFCTTNILDKGQTYRNKVVNFVKYVVKGVGERSLCYTVDMPSLHMESEHYL